MRRFYADIMKLSSYKGGGGGGAGGGRIKMKHYSNHLRNEILAQGLLVSTLRLKGKNALKKLE